MLPFISLLTMLSNIPAYKFAVSFQQHFSELGHTITSASERFLELLSEGGIVVIALGLLVAVIALLFVLFMVLNRN